MGPGLGSYGVYCVIYAQIYVHANRAAFLVSAPRLGDVARGRHAACAWIPLTD